jgi:hypothetical protein
LPAEDAGLSEELKGFVAAEGFEVVKEHGIQLGYNYLSTDQALKVRTKMRLVGVCCCLKTSTSYILYCVVMKCIGTVMKCISEHQGRTAN